VRDPRDRRRLRRLLLWYKLQPGGFVDVRFCEKGGDVGGTWYWNRYPGVACDVESYSYFPLLEEMEYFPTMKFASGFEIFEYCQRMAEKFTFYDHCLFHTTVLKTEWDESDGRWTVHTDRGDAMRARHVVLANGILTTPKLAGSTGWRRSRASRSTRRAGTTTSTCTASGSGSSAPVPRRCRSSPSWRRSSASSTCSSARRRRWTCGTSEPPPRRSRGVEVRAGWAGPVAPVRSDLTGRTAIQANDDYLAGKVADFKERKEHERRLSPEELIAKQLDTNFRIMEQIRARVDAIVEDPKTAEALKPYTRTAASGRRSTTTTSRRSTGRT
jgi:cyclohexanone monooxygenase